MNKLEILKALQNELIATLKERKESRGWFPRHCCKAKIHRLRIQLQELMLEIERGCDRYYRSENEKESWENG